MGRRNVVIPIPEAFERCSLAPASVDVDHSSTLSSFQILCSLLDLSSTSIAFSTKCERRNAVHFENADLPMDVVGGDSEDDDLDNSNNGDFTEVVDEPFVQVTRGRSSNISRSASPSTSRSSMSSGLSSPPTPIGNVFEPLKESDDVRVQEAPDSCEFRQHSSGIIATAAEGLTKVESVTERICREIVEARLKFGHIVSPTAVTHDTPPGLKVVPVSRYSGSFMTWAFDDDRMAEFEDNIGESGVDDEFVDESRNVEGAPMTRSERRHGCHTRRCGVAAFRRTYSLNTSPPLCSSSTWRRPEPSFDEAVPTAHQPWMIHPYDESAAFRELWSDPVVKLRIFPTI